MSNTNVVQVIVSIPRAGEIKVGVQLPVEWFEWPPTAQELLDAVIGEIDGRLRFKLDKGEHKRFVKVVKARIRE